MTTRSGLSPVQLLVYEFGPDSRFEGQLAGAIERFEGRGTLRILGAMFIQRDAETGELFVLDLGTPGATGGTAPILDFRLDLAARRKATARALEADSPGIPADVLQELGGSLQPGCAIAALLLEHVWTEALDDAVARTSGARLVNEFVEARTLAELSPRLRSAGASLGGRADGP